MFKAEDSPANALARSWSLLKWKKKKKKWEIPVKLCSSFSLRLCAEVPGEKVIDGICILHRQLQQHTPSEEGESASAKSSDSRFPRSDAGRGRTGEKQRRLYVNKVKCTLWEKPTWKGPHALWMWKESRGEIQWERGTARCSLHAGWKCWGPTRRMLTTDGTDSHDWNIFSTGWKACGGKAGIMSAFLVGLWPTPNQKGQVASLQCSNLLRVQVTSLSLNLCCKKNNKRRC